MAANPYQAPIAACHSVADHRRVWIALIPFFIAAAALVAAVALWFGPFNKDAIGVGFGILGTILVFDLPTCAYVLVKWLKYRAPPDLASELLESTPEEREFQRSLRTRPRLDEEAFYETFYPHSGVPRNMTGQLRRILEDVSGCDLAGINPGDNLAYIDGDMDFADVLWRVEREFATKLDWDVFRQTEVTFDLLLRETLRCSSATRRASLA